jgi:hypothetical protein
MLDKMNYYQISVYVPESHQEFVQKAMAESGAGRLGNYDSCAAVFPVTGYWRPLAGAHPLIGEIDDLSSEPEVKIEAICPREAVHEILKAIRSVHPYEVPVISVLPLVNQLFE